MVAIMGCFDSAILALSCFCAVGTPVVVGAVGEGWTGRARGFGGELDWNCWITFPAWVVVVGALFGVLLHGIGRFIANGKK